MLKLSSISCRKALSVRLPWENEGGFTGVVDSRNGILAFGFAGLDFVKRDAQLERLDVPPTC